MSKKLATALLFCLTLLFSFSAVNAFDTSIGSYYPKYLYDNKELECAWAHMDVGTYIDKTSVVCLDYNPPHYKLAANWIKYDVRRQAECGYGTTYFEYDTSTGAVYSLDKNGNRISEPYYAKKENNPSYVLWPLAMAKIIWKEAYNMKWKW